MAGFEVTAYGPFEVTTEVIVAAKLCKGPSCGQLEGPGIANTDIARAWQHIHFLGHYAFRDKAPNRLGSHPDICESSVTRWLLGTGSILLAWAYSSYQKYLAKM